MNAKVRDVMTPGPIGVDYHQSIGDPALALSQVSNAPPHLPA